MFLDIVSIGNQQLDYPEKDSCEFESMKEYLKIARKIIAHFAPKFGPNLAKEMLASEDAVSNVATQLMTADWRWNQDYKNEKNTKRSKYCYRNQCGIWAIQGYISRKSKTSANGRDVPAVFSLDYNRAYGDDNINGMYTVLEDKKAIFETQKVENEEQQKFVNKNLRELLCSGVLTDQQASFITSHYLEEKSMTDIANDNKITREAVRQVISRGIYKLQELISTL